MKLAAKQVDLEACPHVSAEAKEALSAAAATGAAPTPECPGEAVASDSAQPGADLPYAAAGRHPLDAEFPAGAASGAATGSSDELFPATAATPVATFDFSAAPADATEFDASEGTDEDADRLAFDEGTDSFEDPGSAPAEGEERPGATELPAEPDFGDEWSTGWELPEADTPTFDFDEPRFTSASETGEVTRGEAGLSFGEIEFAAPAGSAPPTTPASPELSPAPLSPEPPPPSRPVASRLHSEEPMPPSSGKGPLSRILLMLLVVLLCIGGIGGYFYFMADGQQGLEQLLAKIGGGEPAVPAEQRIGLDIAGSSYVDNREAGQLLVIQGSASNNFTGPRSAITVKGVILDAAGKVLQQQTVFCGNFLDEGKLRTLGYAQLEEAMNNQFGDSLSNMNVKPGKAIPFTIVFRNVPKELASINVEVVDSKPGGL